MNRILSIGILVVGVALVIYGISALDSVGSGFSRLFTWAPTDKTVWLLIGGVVCTAVGLSGVFRRSN